MNLSLEQGGTADHYATSFRDFVVRVDVKFLDLNPQKGAGLEWLRYEVHGGTMTTERFGLNGDRFWQLSSCPPENPEQTPECQQGLPYGEVSVDLTDWNTVTIISRGAELAVYLNSTPLAYYNYLGQPSASHIRLYAFDNSGNPEHSGTLFDDFKIWELQSVFPPPAPDPALGIGSSMERPADGMVMMYVPEGEFQMGSSVGGPDEEPVHAVYLDAFWIDKTEVTNAMFAEFLSEMGNQTVEYLSYLPSDLQGAIWYKPETRGAPQYVFPVPGSSTWQPQSGYEDHPLNGVNYYGAQAYCAWAGGRLPTEAEWEKAARGGLVGRLYPWGDEPPTCTLGAPNGAWIGPPCHPMDMPPVASYAPNGYGIYDMVGSVGEWTADWRSSTYYAYSPYRNPLGPVEPGDDRTNMVHRSSASSLGLGDVRLAGRGSGSPWTQKGGIRCVRSP
jgi:formylglycine-generating enzyme required for sulfatase activity